MFLLAGKIMPGEEKCEEDFCFLKKTGDFYNPQTTDTQ